MSKLGEILGIVAKMTVVELVQVYLVWMIITYPWINSISVFAAGGTKALFIDTVRNLIGA